MIGRRLSHFRLLAKIGEGGMGIVYRAEDLRLRRTVAVKVLPGEALADGERRVRFLREARAAAAVTHPNIATIHDVDEAEGILFIAMEYIEGRTLRALIAGKPLQVPEALRIGAEMADGLARAHQAGVIHRDLKPGNLMVTDDGHVKILDFGLAKLLEREDPSTAERSRVETISGERTQEGRVLGTPSYMSPEQGRGQAVDHRSDLFASGIVLYEMLTGRAPFEGPTPMDTVTAILHQIPAPASGVNPEVPPELDRILGKCLEKNPADRYQDSRDLAVDLRRLKREVDSQPAARPEPAGAMVAWRRRRAWVLAPYLAVVVLGALVWLGWRLRPGPLGPEAGIKQQLIFSDPEGGSEVFASLSPDGKHLATADARGISIRLLETGEARQLSLPAGQTARVVSWLPDGTKLLVTGVDPEGNGSIWAVSLVTGASRRLRGDNSWSPGASPDGSHIAFVTYTPEGSELWVMRAQGESPRRIAGFGEGGSIGGFAWSPDGRRIAYQKHKVGAGEAFDAVIESMPLEGGPATPILSDRRLLGPFGGGDGLAWMPDGRLIFPLTEPPPSSSDMNLWALRVDPRTGTAAGKPLRVTNWAGFIVSPWDASADGRRLLVSRTFGQADVHVGELEGGGSRLENPRRLTLDDRNDWLSAWTPDSRSILFNTDRNGISDIFVQGVAGADPSPLVSGGEADFGARVTPDGSSILYGVSSRSEELSGGDVTLMRVDLSGGVPQPILNIKVRLGIEWRCPRRAEAPCVLAEIGEQEVVFHALDPRDGNGDVVARSEVPPGGWLYWDLAPDGSRIAAVAWPQPTVRILELPGGARSEILFPSMKSLQFVTWSADGRSLFLTSWAGISTGRAAILHGDLEGRARVLLESRRQGEWMGSPLPSPDGRYLAFSVIAFPTDFWLLENF